MVPYGMRKASARKQVSHQEQLASLGKIEGQVRGVQKMISEGRYCIDILTQLHSISGAIARVESNILRRHLEGCVSGAFRGASELEKRKKIEEIITVISRFRKTV